MPITNIINKTIESAAYGAACGATYGALLNPPMGIGAAAVIGAVSIASGRLFACLTESAIVTYRNDLSDFSRFVSHVGAWTLGTYAGLHVSNTALMALGFTATVVPSAVLALKVYAGCVLAILGFQMALSCAQVAFTVISSLALFLLASSGPYLANVFGR